MSITQQTFDQMIATLQKTLQINTIKSEAKQGMPFGEGNAVCLKYVLDLCKEMGFETQNFDNYAGHADYGDGDEVFGVLGHLDVVPVNPTGWVADPFGGEIKDGVLYGRGVLDNKGPMIACLYAIKQLKDEGFKPSKKIRIIFGCDEESGWKCMDYYASKIKMPDEGFSPDGDFPVINVEKGLVHFEINAGKLPEGVVVYGGARPNIVLDECHAVLPDGKEIVEYGKASHGSLPECGINAGWKMFEKLNELYPQNQAITFANTKVCGDYNGRNIGIGWSDDVSGKLTLNLGFVKTVDGCLILGLDVRYPVTFDLQQVIDQIKSQMPQEATLQVFGAHAPLYVPAESNLVQTLLKVFGEQTGTKDPQPIAVGGATYARRLPVGVAFGPVFDSDEKLIHETNERASLDHLRKMMNIYYEAIKALTK
ncbi:MAG: M20 family metallopeptidase [Clostridiales bacterium]|nr:M20 family metallopeptidase [Clostridiales bacterium]